MKTVSLELSKQLKKAGYPQKQTDSMFCYAWKPNQVEEPTLTYITKIVEGYLYLASPTADEILEQLPESVKDDYYHFCMIKTDLGYTLLYKPNGVGVEGLVVRMDKSLADAAAKCWLYLKKEGLL